MTLIANPVPSSANSVPVAWFVGREELIREISPGPDRERVVVVSGLRGQGKSSLADKLAHDLRTDNCLVMKYEWRESVTEKVSLVGELWKVACESGRLSTQAGLAHWSRSHRGKLTGVSGFALPAAVGVGVVSVAWAIPLFAIGAASAGLLALEAAPADPDSFRDRLYRRVKPAVSRVVVLIDETHVGMTQSRDLAKCLDTQVGPGLTCHVILFCRAESSSAVSTDDAGPRSPLMREILDFDIVEVRALIDKLILASATPPGDADAIARRVFLETGGVPDVTIGFLHEVWKKWTEVSLQKRSIQLQDVLNAADSKESLHRDRIDRLLRLVALQKPEWKEHFSRMLSGIARDDELDAKLNRRDFTVALQGMTSRGKPGVAAAEGLVAELLERNILRADDEAVVFRGRLLRRGLGTIGPAKG